MTLPLYTPPAMRPTSVNGSTKSGKPTGKYHPDPPAQPWKNYRFSIIVPSGGDTIWTTRDAMNEFHQDNVPIERVMPIVERMVATLRTEGRKRVTLWVRSQAAADQHGVKRVIWIGKPDGPGFDAHKAGTYSIDDLAAVIQFHVGMSA